jgi:hypothetical protein
MAKWPGWIKLKPEQGTDVLKAIVEFAPTVPVEGRLDDSVITARLPFLPLPAIENLAALNLSRERTVVLNAPGFNDARDARAPQRAAKQKKDAEAKAHEAPTKLIIYSERGHGHFNATQIIAQLKLRGIKFKTGEKVGRLDTQWKEHDALAENLQRLSRLSAAPPASLPASSKNGGSPFASPSTGQKRARSPLLVPGDAAAAAAALRTPHFSPAASPSTASKQPRFAAVVTAAPPPGGVGGAGLGPEGSPAKRARAFAKANAAARRDSAAAAQAAAATQ